MLKFKKALALLMVCAMTLTLMAVPAMAEESLAPTLLQYEDFGYAVAGGKSIHGISEPTADRDAKGFSAFWKKYDNSTGTDNVGLADGHWYAWLDGTEKTLRTGTGKYTMDEIYRTVADNKKITTDVAESTAYIVTWEQYIAEDVVVNTNWASTVSFGTPSKKNDYDITRAGFGNKAATAALGDPTYPYLCWEGTKRYGETAIEAGKTYEMVLRIEANPEGINDVIKLKVYPKGENAKSEWDITYETDSSLTFDRFGITAASAAIRNSESVIVSGNDMRFADYNVDVFSGAEDIAFVTETEAALFAAGTALASGSVAANEIKTAQEKIDVLQTDCKTKAQWQEQLDGYKLQSQVNALGTAPSQKEYNEVQNIVCELEDSTLRTSLQISLDAIAEENALAQYLWSVSDVNLGASSVVTAQIGGTRTNQVMIIAGYGSDKILKNAVVCKGDKVTYSAGADGANIVKIIVLNSLSTLVPEMPAKVFSK